MSTCDSSGCFYRHDAADKSTVSGAEKGKVRFLVYSHWWQFSVPSVEGPRTAFPWWAAKWASHTAHRF